MDHISLPASQSFPLSRDEPINNPKGSCIIPDEKGQSFIEFILLLFVILSLSLVMTRGVNNGMGDRWEQLVRTITGHELRTPPTVEIP